MVMKLLLVHGFVNEFSECSVLLFDVHFLSRVQCLSSCFMIKPRHQIILHRWTFVTISVIKIYIYLTVKGFKGIYSIFFVKSVIIS